MASLNVPYSFSNGTVANALDVNSNFTAVKSFVESSLVQADGSVKAGTAAIDDLAVTTGKLADVAVTAAKIANAAVTTDKIADDAVTAAKVADGATLPVNITGNSGSTSSVAWTNVSGKPAIGDVFNNGGTYSINITGSAGYASSAGSTGSATNASNLVGGSTVFAWSAVLGQYYTGNQVGVGGWLYLYSVQGGSAATQALVVDSGGAVKSYTRSSLRDRKTNITAFDSAKALEMLRKFKPSTFKFKSEFIDADDPHAVFTFQTQDQYGFVVEDILEVDTDLIQYEKVGDEFKPLAWKQDAMIMLSVSAVQALCDKVDALTARVVELESRG